QLLERDEAVEIDLAREVHRGHATSAELVEDLVAADRPRDTTGHRRYRTALGAAVDSGQRPVDPDPLSDREALVQAYPDAADAEGDETAGEGAERRGDHGGGHGERRRRRGRGRPVRRTI